MSRVGNTNNLTKGDTYDILFFDFEEGYPAGSISLGFGKSPRRISGVQKVSQIFTKALLTTAGTDVIHSDNGSTFNEYATGGNRAPSDTLKLKAAIESAVAQAASQARGILNVPGASDDAQLDRATVLGVSSTREGTDVRIQILTKGGESAPIAIPFTSLGLKVNS